MLFEGGAGEVVRRKLLHPTNLHTILRLPTGIFYKPGVTAKVIFFDNKPAAPTGHTRDVWYYDYRANIHHTLKKKPTTYENLLEFVELYQTGAIPSRAETWHSETNPEGRWRRFPVAGLLERDNASLDVF